MASWKTHTIIAEELLKMGLALDARGFCVGNIAPDCNVENADWSEFTPPRGTTHWMSGEKKDTADYEGFYAAYVRGRRISSPEERAFFLGYYAHLMTDVEFHRFYRLPEQVEAIYARLRQIPEMYARVAGRPEGFAALKAAFGRPGLYRELSALEQGYLNEHPDYRLYDDVLRRVEQFPDYLDYLPRGAIVRKIPIMTARDEGEGFDGRYIFVTPGEYGGFVRRASAGIYSRLVDRLCEM